MVTHASDLQAWRGLFLRRMFCKLEFARFDCTAPDVRVDHPVPLNSAVEPRE